MGSALLIERKFTPTVPKYRTNFPTKLTKARLFENLSFVSHLRNILNVRKRGSKAVHLQEVVHVLAVV